LPVTSWKLGLPTLKIKEYQIHSPTNASTFSLTDNPEEISLQLDIRNRTLIHGKERACHVEDAHTPIR
jgi:hypothetical protein